MRESNQPCFCSCVAAKPVYWLAFAQRIRSPEIFKEALIHAVGRINQPHLRTIHTDLDRYIVNVIDAKVEDLKQSFEKLMLNIGSYYPQELQREALPGFTDIANIGRGSYSNDIFGWHALSIFRQYINQEAIKTLNKHDMGYALVTKIFEGGNGYLTRADMEPFFQAICPMSPKAQDGIERKVNEMKNHVKRWAGDLMVNKSEVNTRYFPLNYFTCTNVTEEDIPFGPVMY